MCAATQSKLSLGDVSRQLGAPVWSIRRLFERKLLPEPERLGNYRMIDVEQLPTVEAKLREVGYLPRTQEAIAQP
jgi:hypothetical protein